MRRDVFWAFLLLLAMGIFYPELFLAKSGPLVADHWEQHYPWAFTLSQALHRGVFPVWTSLIHCGFPIAAESQIGIFYLPNLILFFILPLHWAYSYTLIVHFFISGWATYLYCRVMRLTRPAAFFAAFLFVFGTSYGGAYYNITSLKTVAWFPVLLWLWERWMKVKKKRYLALAAVAGAQALVAGYMQVAALCLFIFGIYAALRVKQVCSPPAFSWARLKAIVLPAILFSGLGLFLALPQIVLTFQLAVQSNRAVAAEGYAYVGSMSPLALLTVALPHLQGLFRGNCLYAGLFALFCALAGGKAPGKKNHFFFRLWEVMGLVALLFALGSWSPVYVLFVKLTHFYAFRTPSKFLIFFNFSFAMIAAAGFERLQTAARTPRGRSLPLKTARIFIVICAGLFLGLVLGKPLFHFFRPWLESAGEWFVRKMIYGRAGHSHSLEIYREKLRLLLAFAENLLSLRFFWSRWMAGLIVIYGVWAFLLRFAGRDSRWWIWTGFVLLVVDLYVFSFADLRTDFQPYAAMDQVPALTAKLLEARKQNTLGRIYGFREPDQTLELVPSVNMLYGIEDIGVYSPLVLGRYYESIGQFGNINDANQLMAPSVDFVLKRLELLGALDVSHILSTVPLEDARLEPMGRSPETDTRLYRNKLRQARFFFARRVEIPKDWRGVKERLLEEHFNPREVLLLARVDLKAPYDAETFVQPLSSGRVLLPESRLPENHYVVETRGPCFFILMQTFYPGWRVRVDGREVLSLKAYGLFQAVFLNKAGRFTLDFDYSVVRALKALFRRA